MEFPINIAESFESSTHQRHGKHAQASKPEARGAVRARKARARQLNKKSWEMRRAREHDLRLHKAHVSGEDASEMEDKYRAASLLWCELSYIQQDLDEFFNTAHEESHYEAVCTCKNKYRDVYCWSCIDKYHKARYAHDLAMATAQAAIRTEELKERLKTIFD